MPSILTKFLIAIIVGATTGCSDKISQMDTDLSGKAGSDLTQPIFENDYQRSHQTAREQLEKASSPNSIRRMITTLNIAKEKAPVDFWPIDEVLALAYYKLGERAQALGALLNVASYDNQQNHWMNAALLASQNGDHALAAVIVGKKLKIQGSENTREADVISWLHRVYDKNNIEPIYGDQGSVKSFYCNINGDSNFIETNSNADADADTDDGEFVDEEATDPVGYGDTNCDDKQVIIDAFFISQRRTENAVVGIDLVSKLQAQLGATLVDYNSESNNSDITKIISRSRFLRLQDISIALSLANDGNSAGAIQSSLSISSTLGKPAELFAGGEVFIIASTDSDSAQFKEDIGLNITVTPTVIATDKVVMTVQAENDTIVGNTALPSFQYLTTRKLSTKTAATMNYSVPAIVSNFSSDELLSEESGQTGLREIPLLEFITSERSKLYVQRENVLMLFVRPGWDNGQSNYKFNAQQNIARRLGLGALENIKPKNIPLPYPQAIFSKY